MPNQPMTPVQVRLTESQIKHIESLIDVGVVSSKSDYLRFLLVKDMVESGVKAWLV